MFFHADEDGDEGGFDLGEDVFLLGVDDFFLDDGGELPCDIGVFGGVFGEDGEGDVFYGEDGVFFGGSGLGEGEEVVGRWWGCGIGSGNVGEFDGRVLEVAFGEAIHAVALVGVEKRVSEHGIEEGAVAGDVLMEEDGDVVFEVVADFFGVAAEDILEGIFPCAGDAVAGNGEIGGMVSLPGKGDAEESGGGDVEGGGLGIETEGGKGF